VASIYFLWYTETERGEEEIITKNCS